jgi:hypothetical protein
VSYAYPPAPPPPPEPVQPFIAGPDAPRALRNVLILLLANLGLSLVLTVAVLIERNSVIDYQLAHHHLSDPSQRATVRDSLVVGLWSRVGGNIIVSVVYAFLVRALLRGRRWAYRRVILIGGVGILGLLIIQTTPYPAWMRVEQLLQALVLAALLFFVLRPEVRAHFAKGLPGRDVRRFRKE